MLKSLAIFIGAGLVLYLVVRRLIKGEKNDFDEQQWLTEYGSSSEFQTFYAERPYKKLRQVITAFEQAYPDEMQQLKAEHDRKRNVFQQSKEQYDTLVFEYQDELKKLKATGAKRFTQQEVLQILDKKGLEALLTGHVINFYNDKYMLQETYEAEHPHEVDENGMPLKIKF